MGNTKTILKRMFVLLLACAILLGVAACADFSLFGRESSKPETIFGNS